MKKVLLSIAMCMLSCLHVIAQQKQAIYISYNKAQPQQEFGIAELKKAMAAQNIAQARSPAGAVVVKTVVTSSLKPQAYSFKKQGATYVLSGGDATGVMYGLTELADQLSLHKSLSAIKPFADKPYIAKRGIKFNIPLDARTPSYADEGTAAQNNIITMWDFSYWQNYIDNLARYRYNVLSFWSLHQFPSMIKVPEYPDVALDDVYVLDDLKGEKMHIVKKISIDEKIAFWKKVFKYANDRGIEIQWYNWSVFVNGAEGKHNIKEKQDDPVAIDYTRKSVKQFLLTYPNVTAMGVTAGENLDTKLTGKYTIENWLAQTFGQGMMDAQKANPALKKVKFIFRQHFTKMDLVKEAFKGYTGPFESEFKYSRAKMYSTVTPPWFDSIYRADAEKYKLKIWQNVRNDDILIYRWGAPAYASQFMKNFPTDISPGYVIGPDGYMYGRDFSSKNAGVYGKTEIDKNWYSFMIWGRAGYNPNLPAGFYKDQLKLRFPGTDVDNLYTTWSATADVISWIDKLCFKPNDFEMHMEGSYNTQGFFNLNSMIASAELPVQNVISIADYANAEGKTNKITPFDVADKLDAAAAILLKGSETIPHTNDADLDETIADFKAWAYMGRYYAAKFRGATYTALLRKTGKEEYREKAVAALTGALAEWKNYCAASTPRYKPQVFGRIPGKVFDWVSFIPDVEKDIEIAKTAKHGEPVKVAKDNILWKITSKYY